MNASLGYWVSCCIRCLLSPPRTDDTRASEPNAEPALFRLLGYRFSPRLADIGGTRFWRINPHADYGALDSLARQRINLDLISPNWEDMLRLAGSSWAESLQPESCACSKSETGPLDWLKP